MGNCYWLRGVVRLKYFGRHGIRSRANRAGSRCSSRRIAWLLQCVRIAGIRTHGYRADGAEPSQAYSSARSPQLAARVKTFYNNHVASITMADWQPIVIPPPTPATVKRKVFISYCHLNQQEAENFVSIWRNAFTARALGMAFGNDIVNSNNPTYVMSRIRAEYLGDSSVTIILVGTCTHSRRYIDWELKASLQRGDATPNGVVAFLLPSAHNHAGRLYPWLPDRLAANYVYLDNTTYARYWFMPTTEASMRKCIETAYQSRWTLADNINNPNEMMKYNITCNACGINHGT
jgi:hypothetical protein